MTSFWIILVSIGLYGVLHSWLAAHRTKAWAQRCFGTVGSRYYRLFFVTVVSVTLLPILACLYFLPSAVLYTIPIPWRFLTLALQGVCAAGMVITLGQTGAARFLGLDALWKQAQAGPTCLVTNGLYRWVRHPVYTLSILVLFLAPVMTWSWLALAIGSTIYILAALPLEEAKLIDEFGDLYRIYQRSTPALLPIRFRK